MRHTLAGPMHPDDEETHARFVTKVRWWTVATVVGAVFWAVVIQQTCRLLAR